MEGLRHRYFIRLDCCRAAKTTVKVAPECGLIARDTYVVVFRASHCNGRLSG